MWGAVQFKNIHEMEAMHLCLKSSTCREKKSELSRRKMLGNYSNAITVCVFRVHYSGKHSFNSYLLDL